MILYYQLQYKNKLDYLLLIQLTLYFFSFSIFIWVIIIFLEQNILLFIPFICYILVVFNLIKHKFFNKNITVLFYLHIIFNLYNSNFYLLKININFIIILKKIYFILIYNTILVNIIIS